MNKKRCNKKINNIHKKCKRTKSIHDAKSPGSEVLNEKIMANTSPKTDSRTITCKINEIPSRQGDDSSSLSSIGNNCFNNNGEGQVILSYNEDHVKKSNGKQKTNKTPSAQLVSRVSLLK